MSGRSERMDASEIVPMVGLRPRLEWGPRSERRLRSGTATYGPSCTGPDGGSPMARRPGTALPSMFVGNKPAVARPTLAAAVLALSAIPGREETPGSPLKPWRETGARASVNREHGRELSIWNLMVACVEVCAVVNEFSALSNMTPFCAFFSLSRQPVIRLFLPGAARAR